MANVVSRQAYRVKLQRDVFDRSSALRFQESTSRGKSTRILFKPVPDLELPMMVDSSVIWRDGETITWTGRNDQDRLGSFSLSLTGSHVSGHISTAGGRVFDISGQEPELIVEELDPQTAKWICNASAPPDSGASRIPGPAPQAIAGDGPAHASETDTGRKPQVGPNVTIDVLVAYTGQARAAAGGETAIVNQIRNAVAYTNQAYANTDLSFRINLVRGRWKSTSTKTAPAIKR